MRIELITFARRMNGKMSLTLVYKAHKRLLLPPQKCCINRAVINEDADGGSPVCMLSKRVEEHVFEDVCVHTSPACARAGQWGAPITTVP